MEELQKRLAEQKGRHQGGSKWIGTGGTSPYGANGYNPAGIRIGQQENRNNRAIKVWDRREYQDLDDEVELGTRNIKVALRRLRRFARDGAPEELDLDGTIKGTAHKGYLDIHLRPERRNTVKVLLLLDVGGSMDWHIKTAAELFSRGVSRIAASAVSACVRTPSVTVASSGSDVIVAVPETVTVRCIVPGCGESSCASDGSVSATATPSATPASPHFAFTFIEGHLRVGIRGLGRSP